MSKINCLSPYYVKGTATPGTKFIELRLYIYTGTYGTDRPTNPTYTLRSTPINLDWSIEISEYVKDYFEVSYLDTKSMLVDYDVYAYVGSSYVWGYFVALEGFYSYGYFEEGANPQNIIDTTKPYRNLVSYSADFDASEWSVGGDFILSEGPSGDSVNRHCEFHCTGQDRFLDYSLKLQAGSEFTISYYVLPVSGSTTLNFFAGYMNGSTFLSSSTTAVDFSLDEWQYVSHTFVVPEGFHTNTKIRIIDSATSALTFPNGTEFRIWNVCVNNDKNAGKEWMYTNGSRNSFKPKRNAKLSTDYIYSVNNDWVSLPVVANDYNNFATNVKSYKNGLEIEGSTVAVGTTTSTSNSVTYVNIPLTADTVNVQWGVNYSNLRLHNETNIKHINICENKYTPYRVKFINKYGVNEDIWFTKNSKLNLNVEEESFRRNIVNNGSYSTKDHQYHTLKKQGKQTITLNSGFYPEDYNEAFRQLLFSDHVWIYYQEQWLPVKIKDSSFNFKTRLTDRVINYTMQFEFAFDKINTVR